MDVRSPPNDWMDATCRVALAALLHDLGKVTQRASVHDEHSQAWAAHKTLYCPFVERGGYFTHQHAAATALAFDVLEPFLPPVLQGDVHPFVPRSLDAGADITDSLVNAAAMHHKPQSGLQWCIASADRIASGFERDDFEQYNGARDDHLTARLLVPFEELGRTARATRPDELQWRYPLSPLSVASLYPERVEAGGRTARTADYAALWRHVLDGVALIPKSFRSIWPLWLDAFDGLWLSATHCIPSATAFGTRPDVSLYDHSRATAAFAAAIWRFHAERGDDPAAVALSQRTRNDWDDDKLLLIQGDFSGIQEFIFGGAAETQKSAAKLLRGRSAFVSLLCELAALRVLDALGLPPTSQAINAAGKFLIVAPNTPAVREALSTARAQMDAWFLERGFGLASVVVATRQASCNDFVGGRFNALQGELGRVLERAKRQRFGLGSASAPDAVRAVAYPDGACRFDARLPAETQLNDVPCARLSADQIRLGQWLASAEKPVLVVCADGQSESGGAKSLDTDVFGYRIELADGLPTSREASRIFDLSLPGADDSSPLFRGLARRAINAYVPVLAHQQHSDSRYDRIEDKAAIGDLKTFEHLAHDAQSIDETGRLKGVAALGFLKGDIDNLGKLFAAAVAARPTFAGWAGLSRRVTSFFASVAPYICAKNFPDTYTVFAGGDDFFFIGPWNQMKPFALTLRREFERYCAGNPDIHFSAAYLMAKPGHPLRTLTARIEDALDDAKGRPGKNAASLAAGPYSSTLAWPEIEALHLASTSLADLIETNRLTTGFLYDVLAYADMAASLQDPTGVSDVTNARWRALLAYRTRRHLSDQRRHLKITDADIPRMQEVLMRALAVDGLDRFGGAFRHALSDHLYAERD